MAGALMNNLKDFYGDDIMDDDWDNYPG